MSTDVKAPITSARYQPNGILRVAGLEPTHRANKDIIKLAKSVSRWAASVAMAKLLDRTPPGNRIKSEKLTIRVLCIVLTSLEWLEMAPNCQNCNAMH